MAIVALIISTVALYFSSSQMRFDRKLTNLRMAVETLREMEAVQGDLAQIRWRIAGIDNLTEKEILLHNDYEILS